MALLRGTLTPGSPCTVKQQCVFYWEAMFWGRAFTLNSKSWIEVIISTPPQGYSSRLRRWYHPVTQARNLEVVWGVSSSPLLRCKQSPRREILRLNGAPTQPIPETLVTRPFPSDLPQYYRYLISFPTGSQQVTLACLKSFICFPQGFQLHAQCFSRPSQGPSEYSPATLFTTSSRPSWQPVDFF